MAGLRNIFACLVHERPETVIDLVRNLRRLDPDSTILLYNGGSDPGLLDRRFTADGREPLVHPRPRPQRWGALHEFVVDCLEFADEIGFDALTAVDSDQLALRSGYSAYIAPHLAAHPRVGLFGTGAGRQGRSTRVGPAVNAWREVNLWRPLLQRLGGGEQLWTQWTFWPSTVITAAAGRDLVRMFRTDDELAAIMARSRIWATEEIIIPTLVAALGYELGTNPCTYDFVHYGARYTAAQVQEALTRPDAFWIHPVPRDYDDPIRARVRAHHDHYATFEGASRMPENERASRPLLRTGPILERMRGIEGWFSDEEGDLLIAAAARALERREAPAAIVEVGSYCGRSTSVLAGVIRSVAPAARVYAIDPHDGQVGADDIGLQRTSPTLARFRESMAAGRLDRFVRTIQQRSYETHWDQPIALLLIDGLHDYANVARDFHHFEPWLAADGLVAFHDYWTYFPGVVAFVDELIATGRWREVDLAGSLIVLRRAEPVALSVVALETPRAVPAGAA
jgi:predicted O-methyltransferase YrrM